jgi:hypothetical protein
MCEQSPLNRRANIPNHKSRTMKAKPVLLSLATLLLPLTLAAAPTPDEVINKWIEASGGRAALEKITTRTATGSIEITAMGLSTDLTYVAKTPNKRLSEVTVPGFGKVREGCNGEIAWSDNPGVGVSNKSGKDLARARREAVFQRELEFKKQFAKLETTGSTTVGSRKAWLLKATPTEGDPETHAFDAETGLLLRSETSIDTPNGPATAQIVFEDYRKVDGIQHPFLIRLTQPEAMAFQLRFKEVLHNQPVPDSTFEPPQTP